MESLMLRRLDASDQDVEERRPEMWEVELELELEETRGIVSSS